MSVLKKTTRKVLLGGLLFMIPVTILIMIFGKLLSIILPLANKLVAATRIDTITGATLSIIFFTLLIIFLICYIAGYLIKKGLIKGWGKSSEEFLFRTLPGLQILKFRFISESEELESPWQAILLPEDNYLRIAFITDDSDSDYYSVYIPDAPRMDAGELRLFKKADLKPVFITMKQALDGLSTFGKKLPDIRKLEK